MISIFDIELLSRERLARILPDNGQDINEYRRDIALFFKSSGKLKECPLFSPEPQGFSEILAMANTELIDYYNSQAKYHKLNDFSNVERLILVYIVFVIGYAIISTDKIYSYVEKKPWFYYDESYKEHVKISSNYDLEHYHSSFGKSLVSQIADEIADRLLSDQMTYDYSRYRDIPLLMFHKTGNVSYLNNVLGTQAYLAYPTREVITYDLEETKEYFQKEIVDFSNDQLSRNAAAIVVNIIDSITGRNFYFKVTQHDLNIAVGAILDVFEISCEQILEAMEEFGYENVGYLINAFVENNCGPIGFRLSKSVLDELHNIIGQY